MNLPTDFDTIYTPYLPEELTAKIRAIYANRLDQEEDVIGKTMLSISFEYEDAIAMRFSDGAWIFLDTSTKRPESIIPEEVDVLINLGFFSNDEANTLIATYKSFEDAEAQKDREEYAIKQIPRLTNMGYTIIPPAKQEGV